MSDLNGMFDMGSFNWAPSYGQANSDTYGAGVNQLDSWDVQGNLSNMDKVDWNKLGYSGGTPKTYNQESGQYNVNPEFTSWLSNSGYKPGSYQPMAGSADRYSGVLDSSNKLVNGSGFLNTINDNQFWTGAMLAAGVASGGIAQGAGLGSAATGAVSGGVTGFGNTGTLSGAIKGAAAGGLSGGFAPDVAGYAGIENPSLASAVNGGVKSGMSTALQGGSTSQIGKNALTGGTLSGLNSLGTSNMDTYQPMQGNQALLNDINQGSYAPQQPSWMGSDLGSGGQSTYTSNTSGMGIAPNYNEDGPSTNYLDTVKGILGIGNGRIGAGFGGGQGIKYGDLAGSLMQMYAAERSRKQASQMMGQISGNNGAYAANLRNQLMAKDAASGRRSDYGGREVQLQSALAQLTAQQAPAMMNLQNQKENSLYSGLQGLYTLGSRSGMLGSSADAPQYQHQPMQSVAPISMPQITDQLQTLNYDPRYLRERGGY
jgi:hypothetical protein